MKKIILSIFIIFICFCGVSRGRIYNTNSSSCSGDGKFYPSGSSGYCGSCKKCNGVLYGKTGTICTGVIGQRSCCAPGSVVINNRCKTCDSLTNAEVQGLSEETKANCTNGCGSGKTYPLENGLEGCCQGMVDSGVCYPSLSQYGINLDTECLINGQCSLNVYKVMGIRQQDPNPTVLGFFQDITLASTTAILGTVLTVALVIAGLYLAFGSISGKDTKKAKTIIISCFTGLLLVMGSYAIIRLIQFLALAGS